MRTAIYPGSFDPVTYGHIDIIKRSAKMVDKLIIGVLSNSSKTPLFSVEERVNMLKEVTKDIPNVEVTSFAGLLIDFADACNAKIIVRGLRAVTDFEYELQWAQANRAVRPHLDTLFLVTNVEYSYLSSSAVRELARYHGDVSLFVPPYVEQKLDEKLDSKENEHEQLIDEIEEYVEGCKPAPFSQSKIIVQKEQLYELLTELRLKTPDEIKRYQKIIAQKDKIISDAQAQAEQMIEETTNYANALVEEHEIMLKAYEKAEQTINAANAQAEEIVAAANQNAEEMRMSALSYTQSLIVNIQDVVQRSLDIAKTNSEGLINGLSENLNILVSNNEALVSQLNDKQPAAAEELPAIDDEEDTVADMTGHDEAAEEEDDKTEDQKQPVPEETKEEVIEEEDEEEIDDDEYDDDDYDDID